MEALLVFVDIAKLALVRVVMCVIRFGERYALLRGRDNVVVFQPMYCISVTGLHLRCYRVRMYQRPYLPIGESGLVDIVIERIVGMRIIPYRVSHLCVEVFAIVGVVSKLAGETVYAFPVVRDAQPNTGGGGEGIHIYSRLPPCRTVDTLRELAGADGMQVFNLIILPFIFIADIVIGERGNAVGDARQFVVVVP